MKIRKAKFKDVERITYLNYLLMKQHQKLDDWWKMKKNAMPLFAKCVRICIKSPNSAVFVAEDRGKVVGYILGKISKRPPTLKIEKVGHLDDAFVLGEYRRKGVGSDLAYELFKWFKSKGLNYTELEVAVKNKAGLKAWRKLDFKDYEIKMKRKL